MTGVLIFTPIINDQYFNVIRCRDGPMAILGR